MKQRLGIACAIMENPKLLLLDEPTNALDDSGVELVFSLIRKLKEKGTLILLSCHDKEELENISDQIFAITEGRLQKN